MKGDSRYDIKLEKGFNNYRKNEMLIKKLMKYFIYLMVVLYVVLNLEQNIFNSDYASSNTDSEVERYIYIAEGIMIMCILFIVFMLFLYNSKKYHCLEYETRVRYNIIFFL